jgi:nucleotide-binding universal stress UspA family protein
MKVLICHDGSEGSRKALEMGIELFKPQGADIIIVTVIEEPLDASSADEDSFEKWRYKRGEDLREAAKWVASRGLEVDALLVIGDPRKMIIEVAQKKEPDAVVIARRAVGGRKNMALGSVTSYIVRHLGFPIIIV